MKKQKKKVEYVITEYDEEAEEYVIAEGQPEPTIDQLAEEEAEKLFEPE